MPAPAIQQAYSREEVRRRLGVSKRQLESWEKQNFLSSSGSFSFSDILALRTLVGLRKSNVSSVQIRKAILAMRKHLRQGENPLTELRIYTQGKKLEVQFAGHKMEPISGQLVLDFDQAEISKLLSFPSQAEESKAAQTIRTRREAEHWFEKGLDLEQSGAPIEEVIAAYEKAAEIDPTSAGALVNLGTVYFNGQHWRKAEEYYRKAVDVDPEYALAHFNLGNLYDERGDRSAALSHYLDAIRIRPRYADAHYNIALLYQALGQPLKAVRHWKTYLTIDPTSAWAAIARREMAKIKEAAILHGPRQS
ncbi:MAG: tetratricopeptide repeat protein [Bryobacterales bacterium]|nr:tetratricopeptide repeat protein [Bryobacterales bacterium]